MRGCVRCVKDDKRKGGLFFGVELGCNAVFSLRMLLKLCVDCSVICVLMYVTTVVTSMYGLFDVFTCDVFVCVDVNGAFTECLLLLSGCCMPCKIVARVEDGVICV